MAKEIKVATLWQSFESQCVPTGAGAVQRRETRMAFYSGACAIFGLITGPLADMNEDETCAAMDGLFEEFMHHMAEIKLLALQKQSNAPKH